MVNEFSFNLNLKKYSNYVKILEFSLSLSLSQCGILKNFSFCKRIRDVETINTFFFHSFIK